ncbi:MAG: GtrA family protein [Casimicrobiaceae bacterium]
MAREIPAQVLRYFAGACLALALDMSVVMLAIEMGAHATLARALGLGVGLLTTYVFSLAFVFSPRRAPSVREFGRYVLVQSVGTGVNYVVATLLLIGAAGDRLLGLAAIAVGAGAGFVLNFFFARRTLHLPRSEGR